MKISSLGLLSNVGGEEGVVVVKNFIGCLFLETIFSHAHYLFSPGDIDDYFLLIGALINRMYGNGMAFYHCRNACCQFNEKFSTPVLKVTIFLNF